MPCLRAQLQRAINSESSQASRIFSPPPKMVEGYPSLSLIPYRLDGPGGGFDLVEAVIVEELRPDLQHQEFRGAASNACFATWKEPEVLKLINI